MEPTPRADTVEVRYYPRDGSVFLDTHYLIKGVAGALFWKLARESTPAGSATSSACANSGSPVTNCACPKSRTTSACVCFCCSAGSPSALR
jgi:hypothetical protein